MIIGLLRKIEARLAEIVRLLKTPEDFTAEDRIATGLTDDLRKAQERIPPQDKQPTN